MFSSDALLFSSLSESGSSLTQDRGVGEAFQNMLGSKAGLPNPISKVSFSVQ